MSGSFSSGFIETVRGAGDIIRVISEYVPLKSAGSRHKGLCPFHQEKTPSFSVDSNRQLFYCFGCQTGGDVFKFVMLYEKVTFPEAIEMVARRAGVPLEKVERSGPAGPIDRILAINDAAASYFRARLADSKGAACRAYLCERGIDDDTMKRLGLGFAPDAWDGLRGHLLAKRFKTDDSLQAGLLLRRKSGNGEYDRFRNRLIFPIRDVQNRTIAFGGRTLGDDPAKYINSPETPTYKKGEQLYGLDLARETVRREGVAIVVEGYLDLAAVQQAGCANVVASLGTAFTESQARMLARYCNRVIFSYDGDTAGVSATAKSLDMLLARGFDVRVIPLPGGSDPDDFIRQNGAEAYRELVENAPGYLEFLIDREARSRDLGVLDQKVAAVQAVLPHVSRLTSAIERSAWAARLADALQIEDEWVLQELRASVRDSRGRIRQRPATPPRLPDAEIQLVSRLLRDAEQGGVPGEIDPTELAGTRVLPIVQAILCTVSEGKPMDHAAILDQLDDESDRDLFTSIAFREDPEEGPSVNDCIQALQRQRLAREERQLTREIGNMQRQPTAVPAAEIDQRLLHLQQLARQRDSLT